MTDQEKLSKMELHDFFNFRFTTEKKPSGQVLRVWSGWLYRWQDQITFVPGPEIKEVT